MQPTNAKTLRRMIEGTSLPPVFVSLIEKFVATLMRMPRRVFVGV
jgi:hypothetical protein